MPSWKSTGPVPYVNLWETVCVKPRRPTIKDSTHNIRGEGAKRKAEQVAARAARKAAAKKSRLEAEIAVRKQNSELPSDNQAVRD
jgi:hypothetical protein